MRFIYLDFNNFFFIFNADFTNIMINLIFVVSIMTFLLKTKHKCLGEDKYIE